MLIPLSEEFMQSRGLYFGASTYVTNAPGVQCVVTRLGIATIDELQLYPPAKPKPAPNYGQKGPKPQGKWRTNGR